LETEPDGRAVLPEFGAERRSAVDGLAEEGLVVLRFAEDLCPTVAAVHDRATTVGHGHPNGTRHAGNLPNRLLRLKKTAYPFFPFLRNAER
jgi:hypothetical protein